MTANVHDADWPGQWVRVMADYCADPVWQIDGCMGTLDTLPVSEQLRQDLRAWSETYDRESPSMGSHWPGRAKFSAVGLVLAERVKDELPQWNVFYCDESKLQSAPTGASRGVFEYEILATPETESSEDDD